MNACILLVLVCAAAPAEGPLRLSMDQSVRVALGESEEVRSAALDVTKARGLIVEARSAALPRVDALVGYARVSGIPGMSDFKDAGIPLPGVDESYSSSLTITQAIYQGGLVRAGLEAARLSASQAETGHELARTGTAYAVRAAYAAVRLREEFAEVAAEAAGLARRHLTDVEARRAAGTVTDFEVLQARVQVRNAETAEVQARAAVDLARAFFLRGIGLGQGRELVLMDELDYRPAEPPSLADLIESAADSAGGGLRAELRSLDIGIRLQELAVRVSTAGRRPMVGFQASWFASSSHDWFDDQYEYDWRAGLTIALPVFDGLAAAGKRRQAFAALEQLRLRRQSLLRDIEYQLRSALSRVRTSREAVESQVENVAQAQEAVRQAEVRYKNEMISEIVVREAQLGLTQARTSYAQAVFEHFMATLDLDLAAGRLAVPPQADAGG